MEMPTTLIRILDHVPLNSVVISNLYNDDRFFKEKLLYVYMPFYSKEEQVMLDNICDETNYQLINLKSVPRHDVQHFIQFFSRGRLYPEIESVVPYMDMYEFGSEKDSIYMRFCIIILMKLLFSSNFIVVSIYDRLILPEKNNYPNTRLGKINRDHIADFILNGKFENTNALFVKSKRCLVWVGNTSTTSIYERTGGAYEFTYKKMHPDYELRHLIDTTNILEMKHYNSSIISIDDINDAYNINNINNNKRRTWYEVEIVLLLGRLITKTVIGELTITTNSEFRFLNFHKNKLEQEMYKSQRENYINLYNLFMFPTVHKPNDLYLEYLTNNQ